MLRNILCIVCLIFLLNPNVIDAWNVTFPDYSMGFTMHEVKQIHIKLNNLDVKTFGQRKMRVSLVPRGELVKVDNPHVDLGDIADGVFEHTFNATGVFLGIDYVHVILNSMDGFLQEANESMIARVVRPEATIDHIFTYSIIALVSILYINFGAALDMVKVKEILVRPIGPLIAFVCKFLCMPVLSYILGLILFPDNVEMQLGLFFTGVSPSGGASNVWSVILGGNLDLSISMTTINTLLAFVMMPIWLFTLGASLFSYGSIKMPFGRIGGFLIGLVVPLCIGLLIQKYLPNVARYLVRILKTLSSILIMFIIFFAIAVNLYLFKLFTWQIFVAGILLPWIGYFVGAAFAMIFQQKYEDCLAISIEAGVQNTGIAIYLLKVALEQPHADLTTVIPVAVAIMTPVPPLMYYMYLKGRDQFSKRRRGAVAVPTSPPPIQIQLQPMQKSRPTK